MPVMVPSDIQAFDNSAEEDVYRFLERAASGDKFVVWFEPKINDEKGDTEPDFIIFHPEHGLVVLEVKAWEFNQILEMSPTHFLLQLGAKRKSRTNPYAQSRGYYIGLSDRIQRDGRLLSTDPKNKGKGKIPITYGVALPNILRREMIRDDWDDAIIPRNRVFFHEDLAPVSDWHGNFLQQLRERFPIPFTCLLSSEEIRHLRQVIFPIVRISQVHRGASPDRVAHESRVALLDRAQESAARKAYPGVRLVVGPAGSGKTLVLVHQAMFLAESRVAKRILYLCFNTAVVNHVRRLLASKSLPTDTATIEVVPIFDLCERLLKGPIPHERETREFYDFVIESALLLGDLGEEHHYDAVLVDEGQDFDTGMLQVAMRCLKPKGGVMTIALDEGQGLYSRDRDWAQLGIATKGKAVTQLKESYRATKELTEFAMSFAREDTQGMQEDTSFDATFSVQGTLFAVPPPTHGPDPELLPFPSLDAMLTWMAGKIRAMHSAGEYSLSEIAVVYASKRYPAGMEGVLLPEAVEKAFDRVGIMSRWIAEDHRARRRHDVTTDSVAITTIHSAKGLDHACVFLLGFDELEAGPNRSWKQVRRTAYVGLTRARYQLFIPYLRENDLIRKLRTSMSVN